MVSVRVSHPKGAKTVLGRLKRLYGAPAKQPAEVEPIEQIVLAVLADNESASKAQSVLQRFKSYYVDFNELRVTRPGELAALMGSTLAQSSAKAKRILAVLRDIFDRENSFNLEALKSKSKQDLEEYFRDIQGADNYLLSSVILYCCGRQAFPLDEKMLQACKELKLAQGQVSLENMQAYLERELRSADSYAFCHLLKKYVVKETSQSKAKKGANKEPASKSKNPKSPSKKRTSKKKSTKRTKAGSKSKKQAQGRRR